MVSRSKTLFEKIVRENVDDDILCNKMVFFQRHTRLKKAMKKHTTKRKIVLLLRQWHRAQKRIGNWFDPAREWTAGEWAMETLFTGASNQIKISSQAASLLICMHSFSICFFARVRGCWQLFNQYLPSIIDAGGKHNFILFLPSSFCFQCFPLSLSHILPRQCGTRVAWRIGSRWWASHDRFTWDRQEDGSFDRSLLCSVRPWQNVT